MGKPWFERKRFGVGWNASSWQGWAIISVVVVCAVALERLLLA